MAAPAGTGPRDSRGAFSASARAPVAVFLLALGIYHANLRPVASSDSIGAVLLPFAVTLDKTVRLDRFGPWLHSVLPASRSFLLEKDGHYYSRYPIGQPLLLTPFFAPVIVASGASGWPPERILMLARVLEKVFSAALAALTVALFFALVRRLGLGTRPERTAWWGAAAFGLATPVWSINSQALWQHSGGVLLMVAALLYWVHWMDGGRTGDVAAAGLACGLALAVRPTNALLPLGIGLTLVLRRQWKQCAWFGAGPAVLALATVAYNQTLFGDARGGYALEANWRVLESLAGMLFSPSRGLFIYCPFVLFAASGLAGMWRDRRGRMLLEAGAVMGVGQLFAAAISPQWYGGHCWGPRLLTELMPFLVLAVAFSWTWLRESRIRWAGFVALLAWSVFLQGVGAFCYPRGYWDDVPGPSGPGAGRFWNFADSPIRRTLAAGPVLEPYAVVLKAVTGGPGAAERELRRLGMKGY
jgi:hypothetical protein